MAREQIKQPELLIDKNIVVGSVIAPMLILYANKELVRQGSNRDVLDNPIKICSDAVASCIALLPLKERKRAKQEATKVVNKIYFQYMVKHNFDTLKVFMVAQEIFWQLGNEDLILFHDEELLPELNGDFLDLISDLRETINQGLSGNSPSNLTGLDVEKLYLSAKNQAGKIIKQLQKQGYFKRVVWLD